MSEDLQIIQRIVNILGFYFQKRYQFFISESKTFLFMLGFREFGVFEENNGNLIIGLEQRL